ncbi:MFS transporter [Lophium mytilinum]|uniref:MFS transporter n=1 Tax=Lophium mytilinum TaxID=390894 RepID=A0A6A6R5N1_9PEZI|nr:MFS transporter [Lophium mytilinum]
MTSIEKTEISQLENVPTLDELKKSITIDTIRNDEALKVLAHYAGSETWELKEEKRLVKKINRRLVSILCITCGPAPFGLRTDLELTQGNRYSFSASIFYLGFIVGSYPAILLAQRFPIERVAALIVLIWGGCLMCTAAVSNWQGLYAQRFFLGFLESGISPMFMLVYCCTRYVSAVSPLINYGIGRIKGSLASWKYMYLVAGAITMLWAAVIFFFMPPDPIRANGFSERERYIAVARMRQNNAGVRNTHFKAAQVYEALLDIKFWIVFAIAFLMMIANGPVSSFIPIIIAGFGYSPLNPLLLTLPAGAVFGTIEIMAPLAAAKIPNSRSRIIVICQCGTILASWLLWLLPRESKGGLLFGWGVAMGMQIANTAGYTKRSDTSSGIFVGYCLGNLVGPLLFKPADAPEYAPGFIGVLITSIITAALAVMYSYVCVWENHKRAETGTMEGFEHAYEDDLTDTKNPQFRYTI